MPRGKKTEAQIGATREAMVAAAAKVISTEGLSALTARRLAKDLNCSVGSLYTYYSTLDTVIHAVNAETLDELLAALNAVRAQHADAPVETVAAKVAIAYLAFAEANDRRWAAIYDHNAPDEPPEWYQRKQTDLFTLAAEILAPLAKDRAADAAMAMWAALHGVEGLARAGHISRVAGPASAENIARDLVEGYLSGLRTRMERDAA